MTGYLRGEIAKMANVNAETLRYYENHGLLPAPARSEAGYRVYSEEVLNRIAFIKNAKLCGFTLKEIRKALAKSASGSIGIPDFIAVIERKVGSIDAEIDKLERTKAMLAGLKANLQAASKHPEIKDVLRELHMES
ncbi:MerR family transcriptional regulator [Paenibacillus sp. MBLB4367]|uniref:MerR family transcriptional regulator n=1 Tax=Paenibacillus sp. MBLB4367 TaxID=3384767 RepID=UPI0039082ACC